MSDFDPDQLAQELTIEEACSLLHGKDFWRLNGVPRLGIPSGLKVSDGPNGARGQDFLGGVTASCFPAGSCLGASFDVELAREVGKALARETRSKSACMLLGPTVNIHRSPLGGRNFESFSEDPILTGLMASAYIEGLQSNGISATIKHFVCNDSETDRRTLSVIVDERTLREIYLRPFQIAFAKASPWGMMTSYNKVNDTYVGEQERLLQSIVREEWGAKDMMIVSDWWGVYSTTEAVLGGIDLEMPDSHFRGGGKLIEAAKGSKKVEAAVRRSAAKVLGLINRAGGRNLQPEQPERAEDLPEVRNLIRRAGAEGAVLLKNKDSILPLSTATPIAVTGAFASVALAHGGGSASLNAHRKVSPLDGIRDHFTHIQYAPGAPADLLLPLVSSTPEGENGCVVDFFNPNGTLIETRHLSSSYLSALDRYPTDLQPGWTAVMRFKLQPATTGRHSLQISSPAEAILSIDGRELCRTEESPARRDYFLQAVLHKIAARAEVDMVAGQTYDVSIKYTSNEDYLYATNYSLNGVRFGFREFVDEDAVISQAVRAAEEAGTCVVCVGHSSDYETEGFDRDDLRLLGRQDDVIQALAKSSAKVIVCVFTGCPIDMPWLDSVDAVIQCGYAGQELGYAVTDILSGVKNPSGRLVVTYPKRLEDNPSHGNFPGEGERVVYDEGTFVGYRHYVSRGVVSQFPFGFGLSYTSFSVDNLSVEGSNSLGPGRTCTLTVRVTNSGSMSGRHVVLLFVLPEDTSSPVTRSAISLEAFAKTSLLEPGKSEFVSLQLAGDAFSHWMGDQQGHWEVAAGRYTLAIKDNAESEHLLSIQCTIAKGWSWTGLRA